MQEEGVPRGSVQSCILFTTKTWHPEMYCAHKDWGGGPSESTEPHVWLTTTTYIAFKTTQISSSVDDICLRLKSHYNDLWQAH